MAASERIFHLSEIESLERFYRIALVNSLAGGKALVLVGTQDENGKPNLAPFNSLVHVGAKPPLLGLVFRPLTEHVGQTWKNLVATGACTLNAVHAGIREAAHQCSAKYPVGASEFAATGLTPLEQHWPDARPFPAPFVAESRVRLGCTLVESHPIRANGTRFAVLAVQSIAVPESALGEDGFVDPAATGSLSAVGLDGYAPLGAVGRLPYAHAPADPPHTSDLHEPEANNTSGD
jgi:flavin reductase (DIM6/NTAB) family NADH-FMN oxidoreductase RutF